jgi:hypothetical protein
VYGWLVHTRFFSTAASAQQNYEEMKAELALILHLIPDEHDPAAETRLQDVVAAISGFVEKFP